MLNEYNCWLQERAIQEAPALRLNSVCVRGEGAVTEQAAEEFRLGVKRLMGFSPAICYCGECTSEYSGVFLGTIDKLSGEYKLSSEKLKDGGFLIKSWENYLVIAGQDEAGIMYGVFRFLSLLAQGKADSAMEIKDEPASPIRMINHWDNINGTIERGYAGPSIFFNNDKIEYSKERVEDYARLLASVGINLISINNVNVRFNARYLITEEMLPDAAGIAAIFRPYGIKMMLCVNFNSPMIIGKLPTADPLDASVIDWWKKQTDLVYKYIPDLAGFLIKADSEGQPGPFQYGRNHADGANTFARALKPHGGLIILRCFVYNATQDWRDWSQDRPKAAYDNFVPLDGTFDENVILQPKWGPLDFQIGEPVAPIFGALKKTRHIMELQITQEYTGQQVDLCYLPWMWQYIMEFDTGHGSDSCIKDLVNSYKEGNSFIEGFAAVGNVGLDNNWTGNTLAQANLYGYGRMIWDPSLSAKEIAEEWSILSFGHGAAAEKVVQLLMGSYQTFEKYNAPFGVGFMVNPGMHYGPNIEGYEFSRWGTYHRADYKAVGIDRTSSGTAYTDQYSPGIAAMLANPETCPERNILFIHRLPYDFKMKNGETLLQNIYNSHFEGHDEVEAMIEEWKSLENLLEKDVYNSVLARFQRQLMNAREWRDQINTYFFRKTGIADKKGRKIYE